MKEYYYLENNQQKGPVSLENLRALNINRKTLVWAEGMSDWLPAGQVAEIASALPPVAPPPPMATAPNTPVTEVQFPESQPKPLFNEIDPFGNVQQSGNSGMPDFDHVAGTVTVDQVKSRFTAYSIFYFLTMAIVFIGIVIIAIMAAENARDEEVGIAAALIFGVAFLTGIGAIVANCALIYPAWDNIQDEPSVRTEPGKAVGLLFVPLWHYYQIFVSYRGLVEDMNDYMIKRGYADSEFMNLGLVSGACISRACMAIPYIGTIAWLPQLVLQFLMMGQIKKGLIHLLEKKAEAVGRGGY